MVLNKYFSFLLLFCGLTASYAQQGVHGPRTVTAANTIVNEYTPVTANVAAGSTNITVGNSALNANGRFPSALQPGDLIMIYQVQGVFIRHSGIVGASDTTWGRIDNAYEYYNCGRYELRQVNSVPNATTITIDCGTQYDYSVGAVNHRPMVIRVPRYTTLTINAGGVLTCDDWNGSIGGVLAVEVQGNTVVNAGGSIDATGRGFRGGSLVGDNVTTFGVNNTYSTNNAQGAEKGEGVAGYQADYDFFGGRYCRGVPMNGGGGGDAHNGGGGGGANAPNSTNAAAAMAWSGLGVPDQSQAGWTTAWSIEPPAGTMNLRTANNSAGGGRGGYSFSGSNQNATTLPPGNATWGGDSRNHEAAGLGGRPLNYSTGRLFMGGGGGAGDQNQSGGGVGGDGGGLIYLMCYGTVSGAGTITSNGTNGANGQGGTGVITGIDAAGGGGAGGTIVVNAVGGVANTLTLNANGGNGGNQVINLTFSTNEAEGPGGGGGGGYIAVSSGTPTRNSNGGNNGTTNSAALTEFTPNGATRGCPGTNNASITNFDFSLTNQTVCQGSTATFTVTTTGTVPPGTVFNWYTTQVGGGVPFFTGNSYTTPVLPIGTYTYYVGTCGGWWREPVTLTVVAAPTVTLTAASNPICSGQSVLLTASGTVSYNWMPGNLSGSSVTVSPSTTTTYTVVGTISAGCTDSETITVTVNPTPTVTATAANASVCSGQSTTLTGSGATTYVWNPGNISGNPITVTPGVGTTYTVQGTTNGCTGTAQVSVGVNPLPAISSSASTNPICSGNSTTLTGSGGTSYVWNPGNIGTNPVTVSPGSTTTYTVTGTGANGCTNTSQLTVTVSPTPTVTATSGTNPICAGASSTLTANGATTYNWMPGNINGSSITVSPAATTSYTVTGTSGTCTGSFVITLTVNPTPTITSSAGTNPICAGASTTLTAGGGSTYSWSPGPIAGNPVTVSPSVTTTYTVTGTDGNGCTSTSQLTVTVNPLPTVTASPAAATICANDSVLITAGGASTYSWQPGALTGSSQLLSPGSTTTYTVTGTDGNGCQDSEQFTITVNALPVLTASTAPAVICIGDSATLTVAGANSYNWNPGNLSGATQIVSPSSTTTYTVSGVDGNGCSDTAQITVTVNPLPVPAVSASPPVICFGDTTELTASGGTNYVWNGGSFNNTPGATQSDAPPTTTTYSVTVTDANGCQDSTTFIVLVTPLPVADAGTDQTVCEGTTVTLTGSGGGTYTWNGGSLVNANGSSQSDTPSALTDYELLVTDSFGCQDTDTIRVVVNALPVVTAGNDVQICINSSIQLNATGATAYVWTPSTGLDDDSIASPTASPVVTTTYVVTGTDGNGCSASDSIVVSIGNNLTVIASNDITICAGDTAQISVSGGTVWNWTPAATLDAPSSQTTNAFPSGTTTYTVNVQDANGCVGADSVTVFVNAPLSLTTAGAGTICIGQSATISATPSGGSGTYTYTWDNSLTGPGPHTVSPVTTTTYNVFVTDSLGCTSSAQSIVVTVNPPLALNAVAPAQACIGNTTTVTASGSGGDNNLTYTWLPGPLTGATQTFTVNSTETYTVILTDGCGSPADSTTVTVTALALPVVTLSADVTSGCEGLCVNFSGTSSANCTGSLWQFGDNTTSIQPAPSHCYALAGSYDVTYTCTDANGCIGSATTNDMITVFAQPAADFAISPAGVIQVDSANPQEVCITDFTVGATAWSWSLVGPGGTEVSTVQNPCFTISDTGSYTVTLVVENANGCSDTSVVAFAAEGACGDVFVPNAFSPNGDGQNDALYVYGSCFAFMQFEVYNRWGEQVFITANPAIGWDGTWRGKACEPGVFTYVLRGQRNDGTPIEMQGHINLIR